MVKSARFMAGVRCLDVGLELLDYVLPLKVSRLVAAELFPGLGRRAHAGTGDCADVRGTVGGRTALLASLQGLHLAATLAVFFRA